MKKAFKFAVIAMFMVTNVAFGQTVRNNAQRLETQKTLENSTFLEVPDRNATLKMAEEFDKTAMVLIVESITPYYKKGTDVKNFIAATNAQTAEEIAFAKKLHEFLESGTAVNDIQARYDGKEIRILRETWIKTSSDGTGINSEAINIPKPKDPFALLKQIIRIILG
jgi:hypothetical protein